MATEKIATRHPTARTAIPQNPSRFAYKMSEPSSRYVYSGPCPDSLRNN